MTSGQGTDSAWRPPAPDRGDPGAEQVAGYADLEEVGRGGDSIVYRARDLSLNRQVAIKVLLVDDDERAARFAREVEITVDLGRQHPNIVTLLSVATTASGRPAIVMDFHEGGTLHDRLRSHGPMSVEEVVRVGEVLADALDFAHQRGVLHRDVKPQNVLVLPTSWVLADFGIARLADSEHTSSAETFTYRHAAPQILDGYPPTAADDIWSLGSTLFTLLDGRPPFASDDPHDDSALAYLRRARTEAHRRLSGTGTERLAAVIDRCLAKDVDQRWHSAADLRNALTALRGSAWEPSAGPSVGPSGAGPVPTPTSGTRATVSAAPSRDLTDGGWRPATAPPAVQAAPGPTPAEPVPAHPDPTARRASSPRWEVPAARANAAVSPSALERPAEPPDEPVAPPSAPAPVALSIAGRAPETVDSEATGLGLVTGAPLMPTAPPGDEASRSRRRLPLILLATALLVGAVLGLGGAVLRRTGQPEPVAEAVVTPSSQPIQSLTAEPTAAPTLRNLPSPGLAFVFTNVRARPDGLFVEWRPLDNDDVDYYALVQQLPELKPLSQFPAAGRDAVVPYNAPAGRSCYRLLVTLISGEYGTSNQRCVTR